VATQPRTQLVTMIHSPTRLAILGTLRHVQHLNFAELRDSLELSTAELSRQLAMLESEDLVDIAKFRERRRAVTRVRLSETGRARFEEYLGELRKVINDL
jgi:DNA-binding transcriptional ArsR family regulator